MQVVVKPSSANIQNLRDVKQVRIRNKSSATTQKSTRQQQSNKSAAVSRPRTPVRRELRRKKANVKQITRNPSPESIARIKKIRNKGLGRILIIIGNGPSISEAPLERLKGLVSVDILSINKPDDRIWPTSHWAFFDRSQFRRHQSLWDSYDGMLFNSTAIKEQRANSMQFKSMSGPGFSKDMTKGLYIGRSSVYASMQIALWMNYNHIYIFGCDMNPEGLDGKLHFYGINPDVEPELRKQRFEKEAASYEHAAKQLPEQERAKFTFCTEYNFWPFVKEFGEMSHKIAVDAIREHSERLQGSRK